MLSKGKLPFLFHDLLLKRFMSCCGVVVGGGGGVLTLVSHVELELTSQRGDEEVNLFHR